MNTYRDLLSSRTLGCVCVCCVNVSACVLKIAHRFALRGRVVVDAFNAEIIALEPSLDGNMLAAGTAAGGAFDF